MNAKILLAALAITGFTSCSTVYKSGQTPDDVYYSPVRVIDQKQDNTDEDQARKQEDAEDRQIRRGIQDRRWRNNDDNNYSYSHNCNCYCNQYGYGYYNHPYYNPVPYYIPKSAVVNSTPRMINLGSYGSGSNNTVVNPKTGVKTTTGRVYNNSNNSNGTGLGNTIRQIFKPESSNNNNNSNNSNTNSNNNTRTYQPSSTPSSSGSSSSGSSSGGSVSRPGRGGK
jgi:hypothetical protein